MGYEKSANRGDRGVGVRPDQESYVDCQTHAAREVANVLSGKGPTTEIKDPWLLAEAQDEGFGGV